MTKNTDAPKSWEVKSCVACGRKNLTPRYSPDKTKAIYECLCGSKYKANFVGGEPFRMAALVILEGNEYFVNSVSLDIFQGRILLDSKVLQELEN